MDANRPVALDEWYRMINRIYIDTNFYRPPELVLTHLIEVSGGLSLFASGKRKPGVDPQVFLAKALGWWMALCGKVGIRSVEEVIWAKFPYVCPYCKLAPHRPRQCRRARAFARRVDWDALREIGVTSKDKRPRSLRSWQEMFDFIYPRGDTTSFDMNFSRLAEELGELSEAVRLLQLTHAYFMNEAADVFAWLMGMANQAEHFYGYPNKAGTILEEALWEEYPGKCRHCGNAVCKCPPILGSTVGRLSREVSVSAFPSFAERFNFEEALEFFRLGEETIDLRGKEVRVTTEMLQEITNTSRILLDHLKEQEPLLHGFDVKLKEALSQLENVASRQELTQENVDEVLTILEGMPSESRNVIVNLLSDFAAGAWLQVILELLKVH